ncbi:MAG: hypothetical protein AB7T31_15175 [Gemmatimonadales bacterium]
MAYALLGTCWGLLAALLGGRALGSPILYGVFASPLIGFVVGRLLQARFARASAAYRALIAFTSLYLGAALFGLAIGLGELVDGSRAAGAEVVWQGIAAVLYGTSLFLIALWPLAYLTHVLLATDVPWWRRPR